MLDLAILTLRVFTGIVMIAHGIHKFKKLDLLNKKWLAQYDLPVGSVSLAATAQVFGGLALLVGVYTSIAAFVLAVVMLVATYVSIWKEHESFLSLPSGKGWDFTFFLIGSLVVLILLGDGGWSLIELLK